MSLSVIMGLKRVKIIRKLPLDYSDHLRFEPTMRN